MESSKATAKHIKQVASQPQAVQINLICHLHTELPPNKFQSIQKKHFKTRQDTNKQQYYKEGKQRGTSMHKKYEAHTSPERCKKCGNSQHNEGFRCPASKHQCRNCHKYGHFTILFYMKREEYDKKRSLESRSPKAHQFQIGPVYIQDSICGQLEESSSEDSFCLQVQLKSTQVETKIPAPQHLITNLAYKLKPCKKTQYLRARLDTCADINIIPVSVYKLIFKDTDCMKLAPSSKLEIATYTTDKIKVIGSCTLLVVHPDTQCLQEVTFHVTSHEGSVVMLYMATLELSLIQPHNSLDSIPSSTSLITSKADYPRKNKFQKNMQVSKPSRNVCSSKELSPSVLNTQGYQVNQCVMYEDKDETSKQECQANGIIMEDEKNCQSTLCSDKNCWDTKCIHMQPVKPAKTKSSYMWLAKPAILQSNYKKKNQVKQVSVYDDKDSQSTNSVCGDKNC